MTSREIHPVGITEVESAVGEVEALQCHLGGGGQVRCGLHHDGDVRGPGDVEAEPAGSDAKAGAAGLHQRIPQQRWATGKSRSPAGRTWEKINGGAAVSEHRRTAKVWSVALEKNASQIGALGEGRVPDVGYAGRDCNVGQAGATPERDVPDGGDAAGNRDVGEADAVSKRLHPDSFDAARNRNAGQADTVPERFGPDAGDAVGDRDAGQADASAERLVADGGDAARDRDVGQARAIRER